jgi:hypothetical protein
MTTNFWKNVPATAFKNMAEIAAETGMHEPAVYSVKSADRGLSADNARKVAEMNGDKRKACFLHLASQTAALKKRIATNKITEEGVLRVAGNIMAVSTKGFRPDEVNRHDPEFRKVALELKAIAETALDMADRDAANEYMEPTRGVGDSVAPALKTATKSQRDPFGRATEGEGENIERDAHGVRLR